MGIFDFGETINGYEIKVINERVARAGAGILFAIGLITFINSFLTHDFILAKVFITFFMFDFFVRVFINPKFSPSLILGYFFVRGQTPEYVGASQKRFAWSIGFVLALVMFFIVVVFEVMTPIKIAICMICLILLFSESAFGICLGCKIYNFLNKKTMYCAGGCETHYSPKISFMQWTIELMTITAIIFGFTYFNNIKEITNGWKSHISNIKYEKPCSSCNKAIGQNNKMNDEHMNHSM
ncbi:MAG: DUF4395 domain-containing protein [Sulfurovaceae bacterium]|nr:DUF4395 domain-containing protein [Sulfurovaceae bacterium]